MSTSKLVTQNWTTIYSALQAGPASFQSYDFQTLRKALVDYLRLNYSEVFNDFIDSSEFIALIDCISYLGQNLAFRGDLNSRENFIDTAERRDSVLKLARLISYNPSRNIAASGQLKLVTVTTTEAVVDSLGNNIANQPINWNDPSNSNWQEQFNAVLNAALSSAQKIGMPASSATINSIPTSLYQINSISNILPIFAFQQKVAGTTYDFESTGIDISTGVILEENPTPGAPFSIFYQNDNAGNASANTGFFVRFVQGDLNYQDFNITEGLANRVVSINFDNINNSDVWLYQLDNNNNPITLWNPVPAVSGMNIAYNNLSATNRNIYQVVSRANDQVDLVFGDGVFANIPQGVFRVYYRVSNGLTYTINAADMQRINIPITYLSKVGQVETMTVQASLQYTVSNASARESISDIKLKAPQQYYTQNRMVNGEDYNIFPYTNYSTVVKAKAVNRTSSGISRYIDVVDVTGTYSSTNIFCDDGILYTEEDDSSFSFSYTNMNDITNAIQNEIQPALESQEMIQFYFANYPRYTTTLNWNQVTLASGESTGYFTDGNGNIAKLGSYGNVSNQFITTGALLKFTSPTGYYFSSQGILTTGTPVNPGDTTTLYLEVISVTGDGTANGTGTLSTGYGPVILSGILPTNASLAQIIPAYEFAIASTLQTTMQQYFLGNITFGIRYDIPSLSLQIITSQNLNTTSSFSLSYQGDTTNQNLDSSWIMWFQPTPIGYNVYYRGLAYIFESANETTFYYDPLSIIYDPSSGTTVADQINVLKINNQPDTTTGFTSNVVLSIYDNITESDGYVDPNRVKVTYPSTSNGVPSNPDFFTQIVNPTVNSMQKIVFYTQNLSSDNYIEYDPVPTGTIITAYATQAQIKQYMQGYTIGTVFYATSENNFYQTAYTINAQTGLYTVVSLSLVTGYTTEVGRADIYFQYVHNSPNDQRIDPSPANLIDLYILTSDYDTAYRNWIQDTTGTVPEPSAPTSDELYADYSGLNDYKMISDTLIFNSASYKPLFGADADPSLQANFLVVQNPSSTSTTNEIQTGVITAINNYFAIQNWDFGETFYYSEMAAYIHSQLASDIVSIVLVPVADNQSFGSLFQVNANFNEIVISAATVENVQIVSSLTASELRASNVIFS
jgi:hypothetical protein